MSANHASPSRETVATSICVSGLKRCSSYVRPTDIHWPAFASAARKRCASTAAYFGASAACARVTAHIRIIAVIRVIDPQYQPTLYVVECGILRKVLYGVSERWRQ